jgi:hypothetical protein
MLTGIRATMFVVRFIDGFRHGSMLENSGGPSRIHGTPSTLVLSYKISENVESDEKYRQSG